MMTWFSKVDAETVVLVPTRGLQARLLNWHAQQRQQLGQSVWETPKVLLWQDYLDELWRVNKHRFTTPWQLISSYQARLLWQRVIQAAKRDDDSLALLNVTQSARAAQASWSLAHQWQIDWSLVDAAVDADSQAFRNWSDSYRQLSGKKAWLDPAQQQDKLVNLTDPEGLPKQLIWYAFDQFSTSQRLHMLQLQDADKSSQIVPAENTAATTPNVTAIGYLTPHQELTGVFRLARELLEADPAKRIGIVVPELSVNRQQVAILARQIFYPQDTPLQTRQRHAAYRFSLGAMLYQQPYIRAALTALQLLQPRFSYQTVSYLLRSPWWPAARNQELVIRLLARLQFSRNRWLSLEQLSELLITVMTSEEAAESELLLCVQKLIDFQQQLTTKEDSKPGYGTHSAMHWRQCFVDWMRLLSWHDNALDSEQYQLHQRWLDVLATFASFDRVQSPIGLSLAIEQLRGLCQEQPFLPQAKDCPILISGVLDAVGQPVDHLFITGMHESYPAAVKGDVFLPRNCLRAANFLAVDQVGAMQLAERRLSALINSGSQVTLSYASQSPDGECKPSPLLRQYDFRPVPDDQSQLARIDDSAIETYQDTIGLPCADTASLRGGSSIFENQSLCPFRAYANHRLMTRQLEEPEFGLDARDAGSVVHALLERFWQQVGRSAVLQNMSEDTLRETITAIVDDYLANPDKQFQFDRRQLLQLERRRLIELLCEWLTLEKTTRQHGFVVAAVERLVNTEWNGIPIRLKIDRIDQLDNGQQLIIDYKTGRSQISDWAGDRPRKPQLPLYALVHAAEQTEILGGISYARLKRNECAFVGVADQTDIAPGIGSPKVQRKSIAWDEQIQTWTTALNQLAADFLDGIAQVDPLSDACTYCELPALCRVYQLRAQRGREEDNGAAS